MDSDGGHLQLQEEVAGQTMAMAAAAAAVAASGTGAVGEKGKGKRIWVADEEPSNPTDDLMLDVDGDDLIFPDEAFSCLADFPCLASPPESPLSSSARDRFRNTSLASSSSSSSSSNWSLFFAPDGGFRSGGADAQVVASSSVDAMMLPPLPPTSDQLSIELEGLDSLGDIDLDLDLSEPWDTASPIPDNIIIEDGATTASMSGEESPPPLHVMAGEERPPGGVRVEGGAATGSPMAGPEEEYSKEMVRVFFEWLRINRDTISPEDLREIRLKRATIDCAERRLGGNRRGQVQLLKLILAWVQASLQKKKRRKSQNERQDRAEGAAPPYRHHHHQRPPPPFAAPPHHHVPVLSSNVLADPNPNLDYNSQSNCWIPYHVDPTTGAVFPVMMPAYGGGGIISGGDLAYPGAAAVAPYSYQHGSTSSITINCQPFSPSPDLHALDDTTAAWPPPYAAAPAQYVPFSGATGPHPAPVPQTQYSRGYVNQYPGHPRLGGLGSATKEARKKRMARQRRASALLLHHHRNQLQRNHHKAESSSSRAPAEGASSSSSNANDARAWSFWSSPSSSRQKNPVTESPPPPKSPMQQPQPSPSTPRQRQNSHGGEASTAERRQQPQPSPSTPRQRQNSHGDEASTAERRQGWKGEKNLKFLLQKVLKQSDVGSLGRIVLPKKEAEIHLPELESRDGITIPMEDIGTSQLWNMRYRFWPNNKSRMYLLENTGEFVRSNGLQEGDFIVIYSDMKNGKYMIRGVKVRQQQQEPMGQTNRSVARGHLKRSRREKGSTSRTSASSSHDNINDDQGMSSSNAASSAASVPFMIKMETSP